MARMKGTRAYGPHEGARAHDPHEGVRAHGLSPITFQTSHGIVWKIRSGKTSVGMSATILELMRNKRVVRW